MYHKLLINIFTLLFFINFEIYYFTESHEPFLIDVINLKIHPFTKAYDHHTQPLKLSFAINITRDLPQNIHLQISLFRIKSSETIQIPCYSIFGDW